MPFVPTTEQLAARDATLSLEPGELVALNACAGSGKTTTAAFIAEAAAAQKAWRSIFLCYNREMADNARGRFPASVDCRTVHSIAYSKVGRRYSHKLGNVRARELMDVMSCTADEARAALATVNQFLCSDAPAPAVDHVIAAIGDSDTSILRLAKLAWTRMQDARDPIPMPHDGYLKLFVMGSPDLGDINLILVDESQDLNPVILQLVLSLIEKGVRALFVGDTHQSLYGWRLAIDAMEVVSKLAAHNLPLSESWRFPQPVADMAAKVLRSLKSVDFRLIGRGDGRNHPDTPAHCTIARTNALLLQAAEAKLRGSTKIHFAATKESDRWDPFVPYRFQEILDVFSLYSHRGRPQSPHLARFQDYEDLARFATGDGDEENADPELVPLLDFVERHTYGVPDLLRELSERAAAPDETPHHFSTAHRAKGKEWNRVSLLDDFIPLDDPAKLDKWRSTHSRREFTEAANLLYVAVTRGRVGFAPPASSANFFQGFAPAPSPLNPPPKPTANRPSLLHPRRR